jgi:thiol-disulfide isomerase/thioredoxin
MKYVISLLIVLVVFFSCTNEPEFFSVSGEISNANGEKIYLVELTASSVNILDSIILNEEGNFSFQGQTNVPKFYALRTNNSNYITLVINHLDQIQVKSNINNLWKNASIAGSKESSEILLLRKELESRIFELDSLAAWFKSTIGTRDYYKLKDTLRIKSEKIIEDHKEFSKAFVKRNASNLSGLMALYQQIAPRRYVLTLNDNFEYFNLVDSTLMQLIPKSEAVKKLHSQIEEYKRQSKNEEEINAIIGIGLPAPEIALPDTNGDTILLSSLKGKYVLLDFWASWCGPCRSENPNLVENYNKYHKKGFEIYQVSLDRSKDDWINAIAKDKLEWAHVSDLKFWNSTAAKTYKIQAIPASFLLDKQGKIIAKNLRGDLLEAKLSELFN